MKSFLFLLPVLLFSITSCKTEAPTGEDPLPDLEFNLSVTGAETHDISFVLPGNMADTRAGNGSYNSPSGIFVMTFLEANVWQFGMQCMPGGVKVGTFDLSGGSSFGNISGGTGYTAVSGTLTITEADLYQNVGSSIGGADDYFISGRFEADMEDTNNPPNQIRVQGTFKGVNIKAN